MPIKQLPIKQLPNAQCPMPTINHQLTTNNYQNHVSPTDSPKI
ncbi:hypothetical protein [Tolypothrix sp. VBCCA 56010]